MTDDIELPPLPRGPEESWMIDDDGAKHPCLKHPTFSSVEMCTYALAAIKADREKRGERVLLVRDSKNGPWFMCHQEELGGHRDGDCEYRWATLDKEQA